MSVLARARAQLLKMFYISTLLNVPKYLEDCSIYRDIGTVYESN